MIFLLVITWNLDLSRRSVWGRGIPDFTFWLPRGFGALGNPRIIFSGNEEWNFMRIPEEWSSWDPHCKPWVKVIYLIDKNVVFFFFLIKCHKTDEYILQSNFFVSRRPPVINILSSRKTNELINQMLTWLNVLQP